MTKTFALSATAFTAFFLLTACQSTTDNIVMPPVRRGEAIGSTSDLAPPMTPDGVPGEVEAGIVPVPTPKAVPEPAATPVPPGIPEGISLEVDGKSVTLSDLKSGEIPTDNPVTVKAPRDTTYERVVEVLDTVHGLGYLIHIQAGE